MERQRTLETTSVLVVGCCPSATSYAWIASIVSGTNTRIPEEEELMTVNIDLSEQSRA